MREIAAAKKKKKKGSCLLGLIREELYSGTHLTPSSTGVQSEDSTGCSIVSRGLIYQEVECYTTKFLKNNNMKQFFVGFCLFLCGLSHPHWTPLENCSSKSLQSHCCLGQFSSHIYLSSLKNVVFPHDSYGHTLSIMRI